MDEINMPDVVRDYNAQIDQLRKRIKAARTFESAIELALDIHAVTHTGMVSFSNNPTVCDTLLDGLTDNDFSVMPVKTDETIAWHLWHIARIEDLVGNLLIAEQAQILNDEWLEKLHVNVKDTGNAMSDEQIMDFSKQINKQELINYRNMAGRRTREILRSLTPGALKRKPSAEALARLVSEGGLLEEKDSIWLLNFWGRHTIAGLILLPLTRHHMMHLQDSFTIKQFIQNNGLPFMS